MTPLALQDFLVAEISKLLEGVKLKNETGGLSNITVVPQYFGVSNSGEVLYQFPSVRVLLKYGKDPSELEPYRWTILIVAGVYDDAVDCQGYRDAINILQKIYDHLMRKRVFDQKYQVGYPIHWIFMNDRLKTTVECSYPYFYVGLKTVWTLGKITIADTLS